VQFYTISDAVATKETGPYYPQAILSSKENDNLKKNMLTDIARDAYKGLSNYFPDGIIFEVKSRSKLTDNLSYSGLGLNFLLISPQFKRILDEHYLVDHRYYNVQVKHNKLTFPYFIIQISSDLTKDIDWGHTNFIVTKFGDKVRDVEINSKQEWLNISTKLRNEDISLILAAMKTRLNDDFNTNIDLFKISTSLYFDGKIHISERLYQHLASAKITGLQIKESNIIVSQ